MSTTLPNCYRGHFTTEVMHWFVSHRLPRKEETHCTETSKTRQVHDWNKDGNQKGKHQWGAAKLHLLYCVTRSWLEGTWTCIFKLSMVTCSMHPAAVIHRLAYYICADRGRRTPGSDTSQYRANGRWSLLKCFRLEIAFSSAAWTIICLPLG